MILHLPTQKLGKQSLKHAERAVLVKALRQCKGDAARAAKLLGMGTSTMYRKIDSFGITNKERGLQ